MSKKYSESGLSFGIEIECLIYYTVDQGSYDGSDQSFVSNHPTHILSSDEEKTLPPKLIYTKHKDVSPDSREFVQNEVKKTILSVPGTKIQHFSTAENGWVRECSLVGDSCYPELYVFEEDGWTVKTDGSVNDYGTAKPEGEEWWPLEIVTPALWDKPEAMEHFEAVIIALLSKYRFRVNLSTGLHVHVGAGKKPHHTNILKRAATLA